MSTDSGMDVPPSPGGLWQDWDQVATYIRRRYSRRMRRPDDDPEVQDRAQEVIFRLLRKMKDRSRYTRADEFKQLLLGTMKNVAKEEIRKADRLRRLITKISQQQERFITAPDPHLLGWRDTYDLIRVAVVFRSDEATIRAFDLIQFDGWTPDAVAGLLGMTKQAVYSAKHNVLERFLEEDQFLDVERQLRGLWGDRAIRRIAQQVRDECPKNMWPILDQLYGGEKPGRPDGIDAHPKDIYQARAAFLKKLRLVLLAICHQEEGSDPEA
jgi:DNA-directed RNA polymerase specialized sigma24 family protein